MYLMNTKNKILALLEKSRGESISGEDIAKALDISRNAVWKAINSLKKDGYEISSVNNLGYALSPDNNILSVAGMLPYLKDENYASKVRVYKASESTNKTAKEMAINGHEHGTVVIADTQTSGKGRYGKNFYSPPGKGLYMSFIFRTENLRFKNPFLITAAAAVSVCAAIETVSGKKPKIKWINDILLDDKKICGILTEAMTDLESGNIEWIIVGVGVNVNNSAEDFPAELRQIAGSIYPRESVAAARNRLAAEIINRCLSLKTWLEDENVYNEYKERSVLLGHRITITNPNETYECTAMDIDINGHLVVKKDNGETSALSSGKVSVNRGLVKD